MTYIEKGRRADSIPISVGNTKPIPEVIPSTVIGSLQSQYAGLSNETLKGFSQCCGPQTRNLELNLLFTKN